MVVRYWLKQSPATVIKKVYQVNFECDILLIVRFRFADERKEVTLTRDVHYDFLTIKEE